MFEKEIEFIYQYYLNKIKSLDSFVTFGQLASANLHPALLQYVSAEIDYLIYEDRQKLLKESLFDYSGDEINSHFNQISEEIKLTKKFSKEYITKLLLHATSFNVNYVVRPNWSLLQFIFENETEKQVAEVKQILNYLYYYPFYKRILINYFNKKHLYKVAESELAGVLNKIDKINLENSFNGIVEESLNNIVGFVNSGEVGNEKISKEIVELFLSDKKISNRSQFIDTKIHGSSEEKFKVEDIKKAILELKDEIKNSLQEEDETSIHESIEKFNDGNVDELEEEITDKQIVPEDSDAESIELIEEEPENSEDFEFPDFDESDRAESDSIKEVYDLIIEEEDLEESDLDNLEEGERLSISDEEIKESYLSDLNEIENKLKVEIAVSEEEETEGEEQFIEESEIESVEHNEIDSENDIEVELAEEETEAINDEYQSETDDHEKDNGETEEIEESQEHTGVQLLEEEQIEEPHFAKRFIDVSELLKKRKVTKIIEHVFDYDMEEFTKTLDKISECRDEEEAFEIIDSVAQGSYLDESSREIRTFKKIIADLF